MKYKDVAIPLSALLTLFGSVGCTAGEEGAGMQSVLDAHEEVSEEIRLRIGESIGRIREARIIGGGERILVMDRFPPFLKLYTTDGDLLWSGVGEGDGPLELRLPGALAAADTAGVVVQTGKLLSWRLIADTIALAEVRLPRHFVPFDSEYACDGRLLLHGLDQEKFFVDPATTPRWEPRFLPWLFVLEDTGELVPVWGDSTTTGFAAMANAAVNLDRMNGRLVLGHRDSPRGAGRFIEFDCRTLTPLWTVAEEHLVKGDSLPALEPRPRALEWQNGVVATSDGFIVAIPRYTSEIHRERGLSSRELGWSTELFYFRDGRLHGSIVIPRQWLLHDAAEKRGILMSSDDPTPHFTFLSMDIFAVRRHASNDDGNR